MSVGTDRHVRGAADGIRDLVRRMIESHVSKNYLGTITDPSPITVTLAGTGHSLSEDENLLIAHTVRKYDYEHGLKIGDTLLLVHTHGDMYVATAVMTASSSLGGLRANGDDGAPAVAVATHVDGTITAGHVTVGGTDYPVVAGVVSIPIVGKTPYRDGEGNVIGQVPLL